MNLIERYINHYSQEKKATQPAFDRAKIIEAFTTVGNYLKPGYEYDEVAVKMMPYLFNRKKGAIISGTKGIGKTLNLDIFARMNTDLFKVETECYEAGEIEIKYKALGAIWLLKISELPCLVINDTMNESELNDYGTERNVIADLLYLRYREFQKHGKRTFITANNKFDTISKFYGDKLGDRFKECFEYVEIIGQSRRK